MNRTAVTLRDAADADAGFLAEVWHNSIRRGETGERIAGLEQIIENAAASPDQRIVVAEYDGEPAGAVFLQVAPLTPLDLELALQVLEPFVLPAFRRRGVAGALIEEAVAFAEERGIGHLVTGVRSTSRDGNRFFARLALTRQAVLRMGPTQVVRAKLDALSPSLKRTRSQRVLAVRRSMRRGPQEHA